MGQWKIKHYVTNEAFSAGCVVIILNKNGTKTKYSLFFHVTDEVAEKALEINIMF